MNDIVSRVLHNPDASKAAKTARGESLTQPRRKPERYICPWCDHFVYLNSENEWECEHCHMVFRHWKGEKVMYKDFGEEANKVINELHSTLAAKNERLEASIDRNAQNAAVDALVNDLEKAIDNARKTGLVQFATAIGCLQLVMRDLEREELQERPLSPTGEAHPCPVSGREI